MAKKQESQTGTAITNWDEELARQAQVGAALTSSSEGGKFFTMRAGVLKYDDAELPGNQICGIVVGWCLENVFYADKFDPDQKTPPTCFAFCKNPEDKDEMAPHEDVDKLDVFERQSDDCADCPQNQWGSAERGRGKACSNRRRLAIIPAGTYKSLGKNKGFELELFDDPEHFRKADIAYLKVPVTSGKNWDNYVKSLMEQMARPAHGVITVISVVPDDKSQFKVEFELEDRVPNELMGEVMERHKKAIAEIDFPYRPRADDEEGDRAEGGSKQKANAKLTKGKAAKPAPKARSRAKS